MSVCPCVTFVVFCVCDLFRNGVDFRPNVSVLDSKDEQFSNVSNEENVDLTRPGMYMCLYVRSSLML